MTPPLPKAAGFYWGCAPNIFSSYYLESNMNTLLNILGWVTAVTAVMLGNSTLPNVTATPNVTAPPRVTSGAATIGFW